MVLVLAGLSHASLYRSLGEQNHEKGRESIDSNDYNPFVGPRKLLQRITEV
jgi:hypothetical protein